MSSCFGFDMPFNPPEPFHYAFDGERDNKGRYLAKG
jgi:hypothetical protein